MGWLFTHKEKNVSIQDFFRQEFSSVHILDCAAFLDVAYLAAQTRDGDVVALICLLRHQHNNWENFGYKDMDETMGVYQHTCPERILALLTPTTNKASLHWREKCREYHAQRKQLMAGCTIRFKTPLTFMSGETRDTFFVEKRKKTLCFFDLQKRAYSIPKWEQLEFEVISA